MMSWRGDLLREGRAVEFVCWLMLAGVAFWAACRGCRKPGGDERKESSQPVWGKPAFRLFLVAIVLRAVALPMAPGDDFARYVWEGKIQWSGHNPYIVAPQAEALQPLRDANWEGMNHKDYRAIYPPLTQAVFALCAKWPFGLKLLFVAADLGIVWLLVRRGVPLSRVAWYAWNPGVIVAFAGGAHYDSLFVLPLVLAVFALVDRRAAASCLWLGVALGLKTVPVFLLPLWALVLRKRAGWLGVALAVPLLASLPYGGPLVVTESLRQFVYVTRCNDMVIWLVELVWPNPEQKNLRWTLLMGFTVLAVTWIFRREPIRATLWVFGVMLMLSPVVHPWYLIWILPFAVLRGAWPWAVFAVSGGCGFLLWSSTPFWNAWEQTGWVRIFMVTPMLFASFIFLKICKTMEKMLETSLK